MDLPYARACLLCAIELCGCGLKCFYVGRITRLCACGWFRFSKTFPCMIQEDRLTSCNVVGLRACLSNKLLPDWLAGDLPEAGRFAWLFSCFCLLGIISVRSHLNSDRHLITLPIHSILTPCFTPCFTPSQPLHSSSSGDHSTSYD